MHMLQPLKLQHLRKWGCLHVCLSLFSLPALSAVKLDTTWNLSTSRGLSLWVGGAVGKGQSTVTFNVNNVGTSFTSAASNVAAVEGVVTPATSSGNRVRIGVSNNSSGWYSNNIKVTVNSSEGLKCELNSGCVSTEIPFSSISWVSTVSGSTVTPTGNLQTTGPYIGQDFVSGSFNGLSAQPLIDFTPPLLRSVSIINEQVFTYDNAKVYPAGKYKGFVTYTATMP